jgi:hypothetical protein
MREAEDHALLEYWRLPPSSCYYRESGRYLKRQNFMNILDAYVTAAPSDQAVIDIFKGEWSSKFPAKSDIITTPGTAMLFQDPRITWLSSLIGGFENKKILELGPLEAGHTYMMHEGGARSIISVEANSRSFLKCLCVKEILNLNRTRFLYGDAVEYMATCKEKFDLCVASGILYHMNRPIEFLRDIGRASNTIFLWTHYYDEQPLKQLGKPFTQFEAPKEIEAEGRKYIAAKRNYGEALGWAGFCGGGDTSAIWLTRESLLQTVSDYGFIIEAISFDHPNHPNGPALALVARRK